MFELDASSDVVVKHIYYLDFRAGWRVDQCLASQSELFCYLDAVYL